MDLIWNYLGNRIPYLVTKFKGNQLFFADFIKRRKTLFTLYFFNIFFFGFSEILHSYHKIRD